MRALSLSPQCLSPRFSHGCLFRKVFPSPRPSLKPQSPPALTAHRWDSSVHSSVARRTGTSPLVPSFHPSAWHLLRAQQMLVEQISNPLKQAVLREAARATLFRQKLGLKVTRARVSCPVPSRSTSGNRVPLWKRTAPSCQPLGRSREREAKAPGSWPSRAGRIHLPLGCTGSCPGRW